MRRSSFGPTSGMPSSCAPRRAPRDHISPRPRSPTKPKLTSAIVGPSATAIETACGARPRLAFIDPSIGSITTRTPVRRRSRPRRAPRRCAVKRAPAACRTSSSAKIRSSASLVDHQRAVAALAAPDHDGALGGARDAPPSIAVSPATIRRQAPSQSGSACALSCSPCQRVHILGRMARALDGLTDAQRDAVTHRGSPLLVIGGPGTGKTEVLVRRVVRARRRGLEPHRILVISAQEDLRERVEAGARARARGLAIHSFPELVPGVLRPRRATPGSIPSSTSLSAAERLAMLLERADELELSHHDFRGRPLALFASFVRRIDALKAELDRRRRLRALGGGRARRPRRARARVRGRFRRPRPHARGARRVRRGRRARQLRGAAARRRGGARAHRRALPGRCSSTTGRTATAASASWSAALEQSAAQLTAAGDDDQALSRARGAGAANLLRFTQQRPRASVVTLSQSFRCPQRVLDAAHAVVANAGPRIGKDLLGGAGGEVRFWRAANERAQAQRVAVELERLIGREGVAPEACAVLVRSLAEEGQAVAVALAERSVPCRIVGADAFFDRAEVRDVLAWLRLLVDPRDAPRWCGRWRGRRSSCPPPTSRAACRSRAGGGSTWSPRWLAATESPQLAPEARERISRFLEIHARRRGGPREHARRPLRPPPDRAARRCAASSSSRPAPTSSSGCSTSRSSATSRRPSSARVPGRSAREFARYLAVLADAGLGEQEAAAPGRAGAVSVMSHRVGGGAVVRPRLRARPACRARRRRDGGRLRRRGDPRRAGRLGAGRS